MSDLHHAVQARVAAHTPPLSPSFEALKQRKRSRDRRRASAAVAAAVLAVGGIAVGSSVLSGGGGPSPQVAQDAGQSEVFVFHIKPTDTESVREAGGVGQEALQRCMDLPGLSNVGALLSYPGQYTGRVTGRGNAHALEACVSAVPGWGVTLMPTTPADATPNDPSETPAGNRWWLRTPPEPGDRALDLMVHERACASGQPADGRIRPVVEYDADSITVTITVLSAGGYQTCPGNPDTPFTLSLTEAVGDRVILDGRTSPPTPAPTSKPGGI